MTTIDTHVHFWAYDPVRDTWIDDSMDVLKRDFLPEDLMLETASLEIDGFVAVQADQSRQETEFLIDLARTHPGIRGVIGWLDLRQDTFEEELEQFADFPELKGLRHIVQAESPGFMLQQKFLNGMAKLDASGYVYEILVYAPQLEEAGQMVSRFPNQRFILDHIGKPNIRAGGFEEWARPFESISRYENCSCKLSGMVTEADWKHWSREELVPYLDHALESFGPDRLMFGSDWPVCRLAADYPSVHRLVVEFIQALTPGEQAQIMGENAVSFYHLDDATT